MLFNSIEFLLFFPIVVVIYFAIPQKLKQLWLLLASYYFYMCWNAKYAILILLSTAITYASGLLMEGIKQKKYEAQKEKKLKNWVVGLSFASNLSILFYFKYINFALSTLGGVLHFAHIELNVPTFDIILPVGISFYTFQALSYTMDVYRDEVYAEKNFIRYALFVSFFPQLVAGPIERAGALLPQIGAGKDVDFDDLRAGVRLLLSGSFRKIVVADFCGVFVTSVFSATNPDGSAVFAAALLFGIQIYCDFAGYSEIAAGSARLVGVRLMRNFDRPYLSASIREFWRRWHISLSRWLADYVYIPLGGSRHGTARQILATAVVFTVSGLWHGANMTFVVWGLLHGAFVISEVLISRFFEREPRFLFPGRLLTFSAVSFSWIFFRADSLTHAAALIKCLFSRWNIAAGLECLGIGVTELAIIVLAVLSFPILYSLSSEEEGKTHRDMTFVYTMLAVAVAWLLRLEGDGASAFIYFRF